MGCFTSLRGKKKKDDKQTKTNSISRTEFTRTMLPEPVTQAPSLQSAPPSFRNRAKQIPLIKRPSTNSRTRALSAPSSLVVDDHYALSSSEVEDQEEYKGQAGSINNNRFSNPLPLPLPSPKSIYYSRSFKSGNVSNRMQVPGPLPLPPQDGLRSFLYEEISSACQNFSVDRCMSGGISSTVYKATFGDDNGSSKKLEATVTCLLPSSQSLKEFISEVNTIASLQHPQLCKLLGFHAHEESDQRMLVYERLYHGSLDRLLYGRSDGPSIDWNARIKIALCAAHGLAFLHEEGPFQAMYSEFSTANIQVDKDFSAKLSGYGCVSYNPDADIASSATANLSIETLEKGLLTPKSNVWTFGIVLLELLTGRKHLDSRHPKEERNIIKWSKPFLTDDCRLSLIMDPRIKGRYPVKAARTIADIALKCIQKDPSERPTMRTIVESLKNVKEIKFSCRYPLQEPSDVRKHMMKFSSFNGVAQENTSSLSPPLSYTARTLDSARNCASNYSIEDIHRLSNARKSYSTVGRPRVEGF